MICRNCEKEIGSNVECGFCGYNPDKDDNPKAYYADCHKNVKVSPTNIVLKKMKNGSATAGFVLSFFSVCVFPFGLLSFIFSMIGFFKAKKCRTGRVISVIGMVVSVIWAIVWVIAIESIIREYS